MSSASELKRCPKCGVPIPAEAPQGLCPQCLLLQASLPTEAGAGPAPKSPPPTLEELAVAFPQLEILGLIGQGGMGFVFKTRQPKLERFVALKILPQSLAADPAFAERFTREGRALARLNHPNIVTIHDFGEANGFFYLLMEYVDGVNLRQAMKVGKFTPDQALAIVPKICDALQFAHNEGILHRDIKPENILLDARGRVKIADFGIAKITGAESGRLYDGSQQSSDIPNATGIIGTPQYMAPEQIEHPKQADQRADVYSLGVVFYEMLTGELPLGRFAPPSEKSTADPRLDEVVMRALEKEPERRTQSAGEMKTQVETFSGSTSVPPDLIENKPIAERSKRFSLREFAPHLRSGALVGCLVFLLVASYGIVTVLQTKKEYLAAARVEVYAVQARNYDPYRIETEKSAILSQETLIPVMRSLSLSSRWANRFQISDLKEAECWEILKRGLQIRGSQTTGLLEIGCFAESPEEAAEIANKVADIYCALPPGKRGRIIDRAVPPAKASRPNVPLNFGVSILVGLAAGTIAGIVFSLISFRRRSKKLGDVSVNPQIPADHCDGSPSPSLITVGALFILYGVVAIGDMARKLGPLFHGFNFGVLAFPIGIGLFRRRPWWRITAIAYLWANAVFVMLISILVVTGGIASKGSSEFPWFSLIDVAPGRLPSPRATILVLAALFILVFVAISLILLRTKLKTQFQRAGFVRPWIEWATLGIVLVFLLGVSRSREPKLVRATTELPDVKPTPGTKQLNAPVSSFVAHVGQGTIELVAIGTGDSHYPSTNSFDWWKPDGTRMERLRYEYPTSSGFYAAGAGDSVHRQLILKTLGLPPGSAFNIAEIEPAESFGLMGIAYLDGKPQAEISVGDLELVPGSRMAHIKIAVATDPWTNSPPITGAFRPGGSAGTAFSHREIRWRLQILDVQEINGTIKIIGFHTDRKDWQSELVLLDVDNKEWIPYGRSEGSEGLIHLSATCNLPLARIKEAHLRIRPYRFVEFRDVSLIPDQHTEVEIIEAPLATSSAAPFETPGEIAKLPGKRIAITKITEDKHRILAWTDSSFQPGEAVAAVTRLPDESLEDAMTQIMTIRGNSGRRISTAFSWQLSEASNLETRNATRLQAQKNSALGGPIDLSAGNPFFLFAETNSASGRTEAFLEFRPLGPTAAQEAPPQASVHFGMVTNLNQMVLGYFDPVVPAGNFLEAVAIISGRAEAEAHTSIAHSARYNAGDCRFDFPPEFTAKEMEFAVGQIEELKKKGLILIPSNKRFSLFSVTNNVGATYEGFFELRAPHFNSGSDSASPRLVNHASNMTATDDTAPATEITAGVEGKLTPETMLEVARNPVVQRLKQEIAIQDANLEALLQRYRQKHPAVIQATARLARLRENLDDEIRDLTAISLRKLKNVSSNSDGIDEAAQVKLTFAERKVKEAEARLAAGTIARLDYEKDVAARDILLAEIKGDAVEVARIKLRIAESEFAAAEQRHSNGVASSEEYEEAKLTRDLALISLRKLQKVKGP